MDVPRRNVQFLQLGDEITVVALVCEDLAQIDNVATVIRSVGPTVVFTPLLDGPQLIGRRDMISQPAVALTAVAQLTM